MKNDAVEGGFISAKYTIAVSWGFQEISPNHSSSVLTAPWSIEGRAMRLSRDVPFWLNISNTCFGVDDDVSTFKLPLSDLMEEASFSSNDISFLLIECVIFWWQLQTGFNLYVKLIPPSVALVRTTETGDQAWIWPFMLHNTTCLHKVQVLCTTVLCIIMTNAGNFVLRHGVKKGVGVL